MNALFITGTDTDSGKTFITLALMHKLQQAGLVVNAMKPVAAGVSEIDGVRVNEDAWQLMKAASNQQPYEMVNPYLFEPAIAPHIAATEADQEIELNVIKDAFHDLSRLADFMLVEGAGGWLVPLNDRYDVSDIASELDLPVVMVVGLKLGCINHARLTTDSINAAGLKLAGWIGTQVEPEMQRLEENVSTLKRYIKAPCLGIVPFDEEKNIHKAAGLLHVDCLLTNETL